ncbi:HsdM family class I SAM-dependent methyltransferase [Corynebacterium guaraldiae]|nr:N-6 DNA methylase [Corynebacterium guaraldiae]MTD96696.1 N-6 DNA methylase [Corynebacterium guaraldiae]
MMEDWQVRTEDVVRDEAGRILGLGTHDLSTPDNAQSDVGQITTFNVLGFSGVSDKPDGWYLPNNTFNPALILETKASDKDLSKQAFVDELLKNMEIASTRYSKVVGVLTNGDAQRIFLLRRRSVGSVKEHPASLDELKQSVPPTLQPKEYYLGLFAEDSIDQRKIYDLTRRINDMLHFQFGIKNLNHRMIFTACALVAKRYDAYFYEGMDYQAFHNTINSTLNKQMTKWRRHNEKLTVLAEVFSEIKMNLNVDDEDPKAQRHVERLVWEFIEWVTEISEAINSDAWRGEDVMAIFFNEFSRYKAKSESGQVFTPDHITGFIYKVLGTNANDRVLDATCGSGAFLVKSMGIMIDEVGGVSTTQAKRIKREQLFGIEQDREIFALACANMLIHKDGKTNLALLDARTEQAEEWIAQQNITKVMMNPPYERKYGCMNIVENVLNSVPAGTKCAFILPDKKLEKTGSTQMKRILSKNRLDMVIKLPEKIFVKAAVTTSLFVFETGVPQNGREFFACNMSDDGLVTVKNKGRHDVYGKWPSIEANWLQIISRRSGHESIQWNDPADCLSWQAPIPPFSITTEQFNEVGLNFLAFQQEVDLDDIRELAANAVLYAGELQTSKETGQVDISTSITPARTDSLAIEVAGISEVAAEVAVKETDY